MYQQDNNIEVAAQALKACRWQNPLFQVFFS